MTGSSDNGLPSAIPGAPGTETGIISGALARFSAFAISCGHVMFFLIKRPSHPGHYLLSTERSYTNTGMLMA